MRCNLCLGSGSLLAGVRVPKTATNLGPKLRDIGPAVGSEASDLIEELAQALEIILHDATSGLGSTAARLGYVAQYARSALAKVGGPDGEYHLGCGGVWNQYGRCSECGLPETSLAFHANLLDASDRLGAWMSAALEDPSVCSEMKHDISVWFDALAKLRPNELRNDTDYLRNNDKNAERLAEAIRDLDCDKTNAVWRERDLLRRLSADVGGCFIYAEDAVREAIGNTNYSVIMGWVEEARTALATEREG